MAQMRHIVARWLRRRPVESPGAVVAETTLSDAVHELERILRVNGQADHGARLLAALADVDGPGGAATLNGLVRAGMGSLWDVPVSSDPAVWARFRELLDRVYELTKTPPPRASETPPSSEVGVVKRADDAAFLRGECDELAPFVQPSYEWVAPPGGWPYIKGDAALDRLFSFACHPKPFNWVEDPRYPSWQELVGHLLADPDPALVQDIDPA